MRSLLDEKLQGQKEVASMTKDRGNLFRGYETEKEQKTQLIFLRSKTSKEKREAAKQCGWLQSKLSNIWSCTV